MFLVASRVGLFHLDSEEYTAYPAEQEVLLQENREVYVLGREELYSKQIDHNLHIFYALLPSRFGE